MIQRRRHSSRLPKRRIALGEMIQAARFGGSFSIQQASEARVRSHLWKRIHGRFDGRKRARMEDQSGIKGFAELLFGMMGCARQIASACRRSQYVRGNLGCNHSEFICAILEVVSVFG